MAYARWIFKGTLVDEYGIALPPVLQAAYGSCCGPVLHGVTLFANGHVMQMLEGECSALDNALRNLRDLSKLFGMVPLRRESIACPVSQSVAVGINRFVDHITEHLPPEVQVFHLCAEEIIRRTEPGAARDLLIGFI